MAVNLKELRAMTDEELVKRHDEDAKSTVTGANYYLDELARRDTQRTAEAVRRGTEWVKYLTMAIAVLTLANVGLVGWVALR
jgi:hypothetical protein